MMTDGREPLCLALVLCDGVYYDPWTRRKCLMGLLTEMQAVEFPCVLPILSVHLAVTECRSPVTLTLRVSDGNDELDPLDEVEIEIEAADPLVVVETEHVFTDLQLPKPGEYRVQLFCGGTPMMERRLVASNVSGGQRDE